MKARDKGGQGPDLSVKDSAGPWIFPLAVENAFVFNPSPRDFTVEEIPLYEASGEGEHLLVEVRKKGLSTWELTDRLSNHLGIPRRQIGYAGLKDKHALTTQWLSLPAHLEPRLAEFESEGVAILRMRRHSNKLRVGHLKGNRFRLRFKKVLGVQREKIDRILDWIETYGMPNYFGPQRFGNAGNNWREGEALVAGKLKVRERKMREFLIGSWQSKRFNDWLSERIALSRLLDAFSQQEVEKLQGLPAGSLEGTKAQPHFFKILRGDLLMHYPYGKLFYAEDLATEASRFADKDRAPTGLLPGRKVRRARESARILEAPWDDDRVRESGSRRYAWVFPDEIRRRYLPERAHYELSFTLPKGSYATVLVAMLKGGFDAEN